MLSLNDILTSLQQGVQAINNLNITLQKVFPQATALSTGSGAAGSITFSSSQPAAFQSIISSSGGTYKVPLYNP